LYAGQGQICIEQISEFSKKGLKIIAIDNGPGIPDIRKVMEDGFSTSGGLGAGLPGVKRLMDEFSINTVLGEGTDIQAVKWLR
jgi:serine/threonine-protein kinase RsbT